VSVSGARAFVLAGVVWLAGGLAVVSCHGEIRFDELATCAQDLDCILPSLHCNAGQCVACVIDAHCTAPGFSRCDSALHRCVECGVASDCPNGGVCRAGHCATPCAAAAACPASAPICDDAACGQCDDGVGCTGSPAGPICFAHLCGECKDDTACSAPMPRCDPVTHDCVQCRQNADCASPRPLCDVTIGTCVALP
jgi:hypothetical protein